MQLSLSRVSFASNPSPVYPPVVLLHRHFPDGADGAVCLSAASVL